MTAGARYWSGDQIGHTLASSVVNMATLNANDHVRHIEIIGAMTWVPQTTNVVGDDGIWMGIVAVAPASAPPAPSIANAGSWQAGWWNRPPITAAETVYWTGASANVAHRWMFRINVDTSIDLGAAGAIYVGWQQMYIDANHPTPTVGWSMRAWGFST